MKPSIIFKQEELPDKIGLALVQMKELKGYFVLSFKTLFKPNATIPILWLTILSDGLIFLNTHKTRGVFLELEASQINSIKVMKRSSDSILEIVKNDIYEENFLIKCPKELDVEVVKKYLVDNGYSVV